MDLNFTETETGVWTTEFKLNADSNIHVETKGNDPMTILQKGISTGNYVTSSVVDIPSSLDFDFDLIAPIYPKWIKLICGSEVTSATLTGDAEAV